MSAKFEVRSYGSFTRSQDNRDWSFVWGLRTPKIGEGRPGWYGSKERWWVPVRHAWQLYLYLYAFQRHCRFCASARHFRSTPALPKFPSD